MLLFVVVYCCCGCACTVVFVLLCCVVLLWVSMMSLLSVCVMVFVGRFGFGVVDVFVLFAVCVVLLRLVFVGVIFCLCEVV